MNGVIRLSARLVIASVLAQAAGLDLARAASAIRNEPGDPYNHPIRLPPPYMVCAVGQGPASLVCPAALAPPLTSCRCYGAPEIGVRYFVREPRSRPTIFSYDGFAW